MEWQNYNKTEQSNMITQKVTVSLRIGHGFKKKKKGLSSSLIITFCQEKSFQNTNMALAAFIIWLMIHQLPAIFKNTKIFFKLHLKGFQYVCMSISTYFLDRASKPPPSFNSISKVKFLHFTSLNPQVGEPDIIIQMSLSGWLNWVGSYSIIQSSRPVTSRDQASASIS